MGISNIEEMKYGNYRVYVGYGNNNNLIKQAFKNRGCWTIVESLADKPHFVWTQNSKKYFYPAQDISKDEDQSEGEDQ